MQLINISYVASKRVSHALEDISQQRDIVLVLQYLKLLFEFCLANLAHNVDCPTLPVLLLISWIVVGINLT